MPLSLILLATASAGKLADGFRGVAYGPASALNTAPGESCATSLDSTVRWVCPTRLGEASVKVSYVVKEGLFFSVIIDADGYLNSAALLNVILAAYGPGTFAHSYDDSHMADRFWRDGNVVGGWKFNQYSDTAQFIAFEKTLLDKIQALENERAKAAASGL